VTLNDTVVTVAVVVHIVHKKLVFMWIARIIATYTINLITDDMTTQRIEDEDEESRDFFWNT